MLNAEDFEHWEDEDVFHFMDEYKVKGSNRDRVKDREKGRMVVTNMGAKTLILPILGRNAREAGKSRKKGLRGK